MIELASGDLSAVFAPDVGMVGCSLRHRGEELLGQRGGLAKYRESGSSFGIPSFIRGPTGSTGRSTRLAFVSIRTASRSTGLTASPHWEMLASSGQRLAATLDFAAHEELLTASRTRTSCASTWSSPAHA